MSKFDYSKALAPSKVVTHAENRSKVFDLLAARIRIVEDPQEHWSKSAIVDREQLHTAVKILRDTPELGFDMLLDVVGIDYLHYSGHQGPRFAVVYLFKSLKLPGQRFQLKVLVDEEDLVVPSISDLYSIADWAEREVYDQFGVHFEGHHNLKRLLNHFEFVGHPLRKDYPATKRQWLSTNDPMLDQLEARLKHNGFELLDPVPLHTPAVEDVIKGSRL
jgi:NADH:ubiquinone oxidoreductase subunit C